jgi:hypothetical protein
MSSDEHAAEQSGPATDIPPTAVTAPGEPSAAVRNPANAAAGEASAPDVATASAPDGGRRGLPAVAGTRDDLTADALLALLRATFADSRTYGWGASIDTLGPISAGPPSNLDGWSEGRAWGAGAEVRWQPAGAERYAALYLGDGETLPEGFRALADDLRAVPSADPEGLFLWGTRGADGQYWDARSPRPRDYAALGAMAPEVRVPCRLLVDAAGQVRFIRLTTTVAG